MRAHTLVVAASFCALASLATRAQAPSSTRTAASSPAPAAGASALTVADYNRALSLQDKYTGKTQHVADDVTFLPSGKFWYRVSTAGGADYVFVDPATGAKSPATAADGERTGRAGAPGGPGGGGRGGRGGGANGGLTSPDGRLVAVIRDNNVAIAPAGQLDAAAPVTTRGTKDYPYALNQLQWSPDSRKIAADRTTKTGDRRMVRYVESSPADQVQPKTFERFYAKPGDALDEHERVLIDVANHHEIVVNNALFSNPYQLLRNEWWKDSRGFTFEYNQRGHQDYRIVEVDAATGRARTLIDEPTDTFIHYARVTGNLQDGGRTFRYDVNDGKEIIWMSERYGWAHLYLFDGATGALKQQITKGAWMVRGVTHVDEDARQIIFTTGGIIPTQDPYFTQYYRINFDGTGLTPLTTANGYHTAVFSSDYKYMVDTYSRVDLAPITELRRVSDGGLISRLETGDLAPLAAQGWKAPESFSAKGRDGVTDIYGIIIRPTRFDPARKYPVIESIYAGPHGSFVPKQFSEYYGMQALADLGFIVVQIDGMGTANRSKAFHDVAFKNLKDAGFPDRILWHKAVAKKYPYYDITRVGIYGGSAGGQNALGGLLFHGDFYKVGVAFAGCHDNRMDKIWWNEQWMSWPIGPQYAESSNVVNAWRLTGKLMLIVGELDTNVDPSSTMQVANALIKANKQFDLLVMPGEDHPAGRRGPSAPYGDRKLWDFFAKNLLGVGTPNWNAVTLAASKNGSIGPAGTRTAGTASLFGPSWDDVAAAIVRDDSR